MTNVYKPAAAQANNVVEPTLYQGDRGPAVVDLQLLLNQHGANLRADGFFGSLTYNAVIDFQRKKGLVADGIVGAKTWVALKAPVDPPIRLVNVCEYYDPTAYPHQTAALEWLQAQISTATLTEFARRWRNQV